MAFLYYISNLEPLHYDLSTTLLLHEEPYCVAEPRNVFEQHSWLNEKVSTLSSQESKDANEMRPYEERFFIMKDEKLEWDILLFLYS